MSYANGTPFLNLPQTLGTDHRDWFDENEAFLNLDTKIKTLWDGASSTADILEQLQETVSGLDTDLAALTTTVNGHTTTLQTVSESLVLINSALSTLNTNVGTKFDSAGIADPYDPTYGTYDVDDVVTYNGQRYRCVTAVTAAEPFDADKWLAEDVQSVIDNLISDVFMLETGINTPSPSGELKISTNRYQMEFSVITSTLTPNIWHTIGSLPNDADAVSATFNFEKSIVLVIEAGDTYTYPLCEDATTVQFRLNRSTKEVQLYFTSQPSGFRICVEYSK